MFYDFITLFFLLSPLFPSLFHVLIQILPCFQFGQKISPTRRGGGNFLPVSCHPTPSLYATTIIRLSWKRLLESLTLISEVRTLICIGIFFSMISIRVIQQLCKPKLSSQLCLLKLSFIFLITNASSVFLSVFSY